MSIFSRLFGPRKSNDPPRSIDTLVRGLERPAAHLIKTGTATRSHIGGGPEVAAEFVWPTKGGVPLAFLAQVDLAELAACHPVPWLPDAGRLLFFYDLVEQPWGFDPAHRGGWAVIYLEKDSGQTSERAAPAGSSGDSVIPRAAVTFRRVTTYPSSGAHIEKLQLTDEEMDNYSNYQEMQFSDHPQHQIDGYAGPIQDEMELECQLVSSGLYCGDASGYEDPRAKALAQGAHEWRLLLQLDSDEDSFTMFGDCGRLYFWIREQDARSRHFDRTWAILQCM